jgi:ABC-type polysaccharide/polyol phosphate export permease
MIALAKAGWLDILEGIENWRVWHLMGTSELRGRYARSRFGQFWHTLSTGILIGSIGLVWSVLWRMPVSDMMPYFAASMVLWTWLTGFIGDATTVFVNNNRYFINQRMSFTTAIAALLYQHVLILLHNAAIVVLVFVFFQQPVGFSALLVVPGFCLTVLTGLWLCYVIATLCARYRDLGQVFKSILQIAFLLTPVLWKVEFVPEAYRKIIYFNPFAVYLSVVRDPILGKPVPLNYWFIATGIAIGGFLLTLPFIGRYQHRIVYWL